MPSSGWQPHTHLQSDLRPQRSRYNTFAKAVVDTAASLGQAGDKAFFKNQAQTHIAAALETLREIGADVTLENAYHLLLDQSDLDEAMTDLASSHQTMRRRELAEHFANRFLSQPPEQIGGVKETIANYLQPFITPEIGPDLLRGGKQLRLRRSGSSGKIICVAMPQKVSDGAPLRAKHVSQNALLHARSAPVRQGRRTNVKRDNLLILWADEAQRFVTASEDGMSDYNCIDVIREARATVVAAAQSSTSFIPPLGREKARVFTLNLRNRLIFKAADEEGAVEALSSGKSARSRNHGATTAEKCPEIIRSRTSTRSSRTLCECYGSTPPSSSIANAGIGESCSAD